MSFFKYTLLVAALYLIGTSGLQAQVSVGAGLALNAEQRLQTTLQQSQYFGSNFNFPGIGYLLQATAMVPYQELLLGAKALHAVPQAATTELGSAQVKSEAAFIEIGIPLGNNPAWKLYPFAGAGVQRTTLQLQNRSNHTMVFSSKTALASGNTGTFTCTGFALDGGLALRSRLGNGAADKRRFLLGFDMGTFGLPILQNWKHKPNSETIETLGGTHNQNFYLSVSLGYDFTRKP